MFPVKIGGFSTSTSPSSLLSPKPGKTTSASSSPLKFDSGYANETRNPSIDKNVDYRRLDETLKADVSSMDFTDSTDFNNGSVTEPIDK